MTNTIVSWGSAWKVMSHIKIYLSLKTFLFSYQLQMQLNRNAISSLPRKKSSWRHVKFLWSQKRNNCTFLNLITVAARFSNHLGNKDDDETFGKCWSIILRSVKIKFRLLRLAFASIAECWAPSSVDGRMEFPYSYSSTVWWQRCAFCNRKWRLHYEPTAASMSYIIFHHKTLHFHALTFAYVH